MMYYASECASTGWPGEPEMDPIQDEHPDEDIGYEITPSICMERAHKAVINDSGVIGGASTACLINMNATTGRLTAANLGDSGFYIIRGQTMFYKEPAQTHYFNCPRQLSKFPEGYTFDSWRMDTFKNAAQYTTRLLHGDIVIAYTDGLSDNVFEEETLKHALNILRRPKTEAEKAQLLADFLVLHARRCMFDFTRISPFEIEWAEQNKKKQVNRGGKIDEYVNDRAN